MENEQKRRRISIGLKLNILVITSILIVSIGLIVISYTIYSNEVESLYFDKVERAASAVSEGYVSFDDIQYLWETFNTDEFREVRQRAIEADDDEIIKDWMRNTYPKRDPMTQGIENMTEEEKESLSLYNDYYFFNNNLRGAKETFGLKSVYIQYVEDGVTYNLIDPDESLRNIGTIEPPIEEFAKYKGNERIPATIYQYNGEWLCTACEKIEAFVGDKFESVAQVGVDIDMNDVVAERYTFILNSALFIIVLIILTIIASMFMTRKFITKPIKQLSDSATGFAKNDVFAKEDVIKHPVQSNDEIGDLYQDIQSMQMRIIDSADKLERITSERERVKTELRMASDIQNSMLPSEFPPFPDRNEFELYANMDPAKEVGGDFYDFFLIDDNHLCILIADVSGKGVPASLFMMSSKILIKYRAESGGSPGEILTDVNCEISKGNKSFMFVTVWMGILDIASGVITYANAGHEPPAIMTGNGKFAISKEKHGALLGAFGKEVYTDNELQLESGDTIFLYTDGVVEANNSIGDMYEMERLENALNKVPYKSPEDVINGVREDVNEFVNGAEQFDDITMLCLKYIGKGKED